MSPEQRERTRLRQRAYRAANAELCREKRHAYLAAHPRNPEENRASSRRWREANPERARNHVRRSHLKNKFGITPEQYDEMVALQGGGCAICGGRQPHGVLLSIDHDHETNKVRGLLCVRCNRGIGAFRDNVGVLLRATEYLKSAENA